MRDKIFKILNKIYAIVLLISFFAGFLPLFPFIIAIIIGGPIAESICLFIYNQYYPWVIVAAAVSVLIGLIAMYINKAFPFVIKKDKNKKDDVDENQPIMENEEQENNLNENKD